MSFSEYKRQISTFERKNSEAEVIKNIMKLFPDDFDSRAILYYLSLCVVIDGDAFEAEGRNMNSRNENVIFEVVSKAKFFIN